MEEIRLLGRDRAPGWCGIQRDEISWAWWDRPAVFARPGSEEGGSVLFSFGGLFFVFCFGFFETGFLESFRERFQALVLKTTITKLIS